MGSKLKVGNTRVALPSFPSIGPLESAVVWSRQLRKQSCADCWWICSPSFSSYFPTSPTLRPHHKHGAIPVFQIDSIDSIRLRYSCRWLWISRRRPPSASRIKVGLWKVLNTAFSGGQMSRKMSKSTCKSHGILRNKLARQFLHSTVTFWSSSPKASNFFFCS